MFGNMDNPFDAVITSTHLDYLQILNRGGLSYPITVLDIHPSRNIYIYIYIYYSFFTRTSVYTGKKKYHTMATKHINIK